MQFEEQGRAPMPRKDPKRLYEASSDFLWIVLMTG